MIMISSDVMFRAYKNNNVVVACLIDIPTEITGESFSTFDTIGFKSATYSKISRITVLANPEQYAPIREQLSSMGYCLNVISRYSEKLYKQRTLDRVKKELSG